MPHKRILGALALILTLCVLASSCTLIDNDNSENNITLGNQSLSDGTVLSDDGRTLITAPSNAVNYVIPNTVETVAGYAFFKCSNMQSITFPESVKTLEAHTFDGLGQITVNIPWSATYMDSVPPFFNIVRTGTPPLTHTVTFNTNGGNDIASQTVEDGKTATQPAMPEKHGYYFMGWYSNEALTSSFSFSSEITADTTLYAKWVPAIYLHIKVLDDGGQKVRKGNVNSYGIVSRNYDGTGPYENIGLADSMISDGFTFLGFGDTVLDAFHIFDNGYINQAYVTNTDVRGLLGLNTTSTDLDRKVLSEYHQDVYATYTNNHWYIRTNEFSENYTVSFNSNGGSAVASQTVAIDSAAAKPADPTKSGFTFGGWYTDAELTAEHSFSAFITSDLTLYAKWIAVVTEGEYAEILSSHGIKVTATLYDNTIRLSILNTSAEPRWVTVEWGDSASDNVPISPGNSEQKVHAYTASGTYIGLVTVLNIDKQELDSSEFTVSVIVTYTVTFNSNGGSAVDQQITDGNTKAVRPSEPTKDGYVFGGWYTNSELTSEYTFTAPVTQNITLYAKWYEHVIITSVPSIDDITATVDGRTVTLALKAQNYAKILWDMGDGSDLITTYQPNITYTYENGGSYKVTATAINDVGESEPVVQNVAISEENNNSESETNYYWIIGIILAAIVAVAIVGVIKS